MYNINVIYLIYFCPEIKNRPKTLYYSTIIYTVVIYYIILLALLFVYLFY